MVSSDAISRPGIAGPSPRETFAMMLGSVKWVVASTIALARRAKAIVEATTHFADPGIIAKVSRGLGPAMPGLEIAGLETTFAQRGW